jgi:cytochrome c553
MTSIYRISLVMCMGIFIPGAAWCLTSIELVAQGRALYFGTQNFSEAPETAGASLPASSGACVSCHGALGAGVREGSLAAPNIALQGAKLNTAWVDAAMHGKSPQGRPLNAAMPRYRLSLDEQAALQSYAPLLGSASDVVRGITDTEILMGVLTGNSSNSAGGAEVLLGIQKTFAQINARGGLHGRHLRAITVENLNQAQSVFALVGSINQVDGAEDELRASRLPDLASLALSRDAVSRRAWSVPLLPSLAEQADMLVKTLVEKSAGIDCFPLLLDTAQIVNLQDSNRFEVPLFSTAQSAALAVQSSRVCLGLIATAASSAPLLEALAKDGRTVPLIVRLAATATGPSKTSPEMLIQVLPMPLALAAHANQLDQSIWRSLGEAAGLSVIEALARSGRRLQPEIVLAAMRGLTGFSPLVDAPLVWSGSRNHGWKPALWTASLDGVAVQQSQLSQGEKK